ncbi:unnamed protein product [Rotaria sp. Silwood2]|nr:unnamed protein product [Rotaria sp. Silwood2]CAF3133883.1 unnamed protein product [Rotaria sp. Silwood2]CAF4005685.1 unnamed protein product [Rotaria sp. Silwood2]CAF4155295.1 unnamed protein product [Rotaria sp. Silwood2]
MAKRKWNFVDKFFNDNDLQSVLAQNKVSVKCAEEAKAEKKITYKCSKYRKYPEYEFQMKVISDNYGEIMFSPSNTYNHDYRATKIRAPLPVRDIVRNAAAADLSQCQTRRGIQNQYEGIVSRSQITNLLKYYRSITTPDVYSVDDLQSCCNQRSVLDSDRMLMHDPFIPTFYVNSCNELFMFITTRKFISTAQLSNLLQADATFF